MYDTKTTSIDSCSTTGSLASRLDRGRSLRRSRQAAWLGVLAAALLPAVTHAGTCGNEFEYCVIGTSTATDWTWKSDSIEHTADASGLGLNVGDTALDIVAAMVTDMNARGATAVVSTPPTCFVVTSCFPLRIDGTKVPQAPNTISFNPQIALFLPEPSPAAGLLWGVVLLAGVARDSARRRRRV